MTATKNLSLDLQEIIKNWQSYLMIQCNYSNHTLESYLNDLNNFLQFSHSYLSENISLKILASIDIRLMRSWLTYRHENGHSKSSNARALSSIKNFYNYLEKKHNIVCHAVFAIKSPKKSATLPKALSETETKLSINNIEQQHSPDKWIDLRNKALLFLIYSSGLRISEALSLTKSHILDSDFIRIIGKGQKERRVPWIEEARTLVKRYLSVVPYDIPAGESIFRGKQGKILQRAVFNKILINLRRQIGLPEHLSPHAFRHSFATHLLESGADLRSIQSLLGHKSLSSTQKYTKINRKHLESVYDKAHPGAKNKL